ncbi:hypothetical protein BWD12_05050 [Leptospira santarosai serovar Bananal]|nr:hypothetical protein BWD11_07045 [Leptospira santarosai serovar Grippotyphosa]ONF80714.1 hypothetical protein BWD12_05050 [Leptospira santarosai serovar Bananal]
MLSGDFVFDISLLQTILFALFAIMTLFQGRLVRLFAPSGLLWLGICMLRFDILEFRPSSDLKTYRYIRLRVVLRIISG